MEGIFHRDNFIFFLALVMEIFPRQLDGAFQRLRSAVGKKDLVKSGGFAELFRCQRLGLHIKIIGSVHNMRHLVLQRLY